MTQGVTGRLAQLALGPAQDPDALRMMRLSLVDWAACGIAGAREPVARILRDMVLEEGGQGIATVIGSPTRAPARGAALVNGAASHALDYDDTHFGHIGHPSVAVLPAALAVAQATGAGGAAFLAACLVGVEASIRAGMWLGRPHYQIGFHQTATAGTFGAAAAAGRLMGLEHDRMCHALGLAATRAAGLKSQFGTMGKPYHAGMASAAGVEVAQLAAAGFVSRSDGMECAQGFGPTHAGAADASALEGLGETWRFLTVKHKFHACCHGTHAALEALGALRGGLDPQAVEVVEITTHPRWLSVCNIAKPRTGLEAKFSYRLTAAMALAGRDTAALATFSDAACADPDLLRLRDRVIVATDDSLPETAARVRVGSGGRTHEAAHDLNAPMTLDTRRDRLLAKAAALVGQDTAARLRHAVTADSRDLVASLVAEFC